MRHDTPRESSGSQHFPLVANPTVCRLNGSY